jgi:hypothetical protein
MKTSEREKHTYERLRTLVGKTIEGVVVMGGNPRTITLQTDDSKSVVLYIDYHGEIAVK